MGKKIIYLYISARYTYERKAELKKFIGRVGKGAALF
jgi:hypothetical protein